MMLLERRGPLLLAYLGLAAAIAFIVWSML